MGQKKARTAAFLAEHPWCCFCGGTTPATTRDHLPPAGVFRNRIAPTNYVFPACARCNNHSAVNDDIFGMVARFDGLNPPTDADEAEMLKRIDAFTEKHRALAQKMILSPNELRRWMRDVGLAKPDGVAYGEIPFIKIPDELVAAVNDVGVKLTKALHYKHTGRIVPIGAHVATKWWTNGHKLAGRFPSKTFEALKKKPELKNGKVDLSDQFSYVFETSPEGDLGAYLAAFRLAFIVAGIVVFNPSSINVDPRTELAVDPSSLDQRSEP